MGSIRIALLSPISKVYFAGRGGLVSTVDDYAKFAQMLANGGELNGERLLSPGTVKLMSSVSYSGISSGTNCGRRLRPECARY